MVRQQRFNWYMLALALAFTGTALFLTIRPAPAKLAAKSPHAEARTDADSVTTPSSIRLGYFPNITHAQALIGNIRGDFQRAIGDDVRFTTATFNAGPSIIEAIYAGHLDLAYVGPSPTINGFLRSNGDALRVISGSANNGILIIGNRKRGITRLDQLPGKRIATPQYGNTQDISAKAYLTTTLGARLKDRGGDTDVIPLANPDIEILFEKDQIDAAWVPEPWGSRIISKGLANLIAEEKDLWSSGRFTLTSVIVRRDFLEKHPLLVQKFLEAHIRITEELKANPPAFADLLNGELKRLTGKPLPIQVVLDSLKHTEFTIDPTKESYARFFQKAKALRLVKGDALDVDELVDLGPLERATATLGADQLTFNSTTTTRSVTQ